MLNVAVVMGRMVTDPEIRHTPNSIAVTNFVLAVDRSYVKSGTERQTDFIDVVAWRGTAEFVCKHFRKGQMMAVHGAIQTRTYTDKDGNKRKAFEIVADEVHFCGVRSENNSNRPETSNGFPALAVIDPDEDRDPVFIPDEYETIRLSSNDDLPF